MCVYECVGLTVLHNSLDGLNMNKRAWVECYSCTLQRNGATIVKYCRQISSGIKALKLKGLCLHISLHFGLGSRQLVADESKVWMALVYIPR